MALAPVRFEHPPVVEVACGAIFDPQQLLLQTAHIGSFWQTVREKYPFTTDCPPIAQLAEVFGPPMIFPVLTEYGPLPPIRRVWLTNDTGRHLIQLQGDSIYYNWKRVEDQDEYPSYAKIIIEFTRLLRTFEEFVEQQQIGKLAFRQFELAYVNHIVPETDDDPSYGDVLIDHIRPSGVRRILPTPEGLNWVTTYTLPNAEGRLRVTAQSAVRVKDQARVMRLDLAVRGAPAEDADEKLQYWFDLAHDWITQGFVDSTTKKYRNRWGESP